MGYCLLYESMLESVLSVRDRLLKPGGLMFPERARICVAGLDHESLKRQYDSTWVNNEYGVKMSCMKESSDRFIAVEWLYPQLIVTDPACVFEADLRTCRPQALEFASAYQLQVPDTNRPFTTQKLVNALAIWFEVDFPSTQRVTTLSTSPFYPLTHWKQQLVYLPTPMRVQGG